MSPATDPATRQAFITGLRDLADYLASHPAVPVPRHGTEILLSAPQHRRRRLRPGRPLRPPARRHPPTTTSPSPGTTRAVRSFGPVGYRMTAISDHAMARHHAEMTYSGCVTPDPQPDTWT